MPAELASLVWWFLLLLVARAVFLPWGSRRTLHDPFSALLALPEIAGIGEVAATAPLIGLGGLGEGAALAGSIAGGLGEAGLGFEGLAPAFGLAEAAATPEGLSAGTLAPGAVDLAAPGILSPTDLAAPGIESGTLPSANSLTGLTGTTSGIPTATLNPIDITAAAPAPTPVAPVVAPPAELGSALGTTSGLGTDQLASLGTVSDAAPATTGLAADTGGTATGAISGSSGFPVDAAGGSDGTVGGTSGGSSLLSKVGLGGVENFFKDNKGLIGGLGAVLPLVQSLFSSTPKLPQLNVSTAAADQAAAAAGQEAAVGGALQGASLSGSLPPGAQGIIDQAKASAAAKIKSNYASQGLSGSSSEAEDIAASNVNVEGQAIPILNQLMQQGIQATGAGIGGLTGAGGLALQQAEFQLKMDDELQQALKELSTNLVLATLPSKLAA